MASQVQEEAAAKATEFQPERTLDSDEDREPFDPKLFGPQDRHAVLFIGMAGTGKSSLYHRLNSYLSQHKMKKLLVNLDPATVKTKANIDIRDTVDYQKVMQEYKLGPNGGIMTSLNLFATKFDQVLDIIEQRKGFVLMDTPGQIELFTWSASGAIIAETLGNTLCTTILYVVDTVKCQDPVTFMSNMMYAVSILYKLKLPFLLVFNKIDVADHSTCVEWMKDYETFQAVVEDETYMSTLMSSMSLVLEEFYQGIKVVGVSAMTGEGMDKLLIALKDIEAEYLATKLNELNLK